MQPVGLRCQLHTVGEAHLCPVHLLREVPSSCWVLGWRIPAH